MALWGKSVSEIFRSYYIYLSICNLLTSSELNSKNSSGSSNVSLSEEGQSTWKNIRAALRCTCQKKDYWQLKFCFLLGLIECCHSISFITFKDLSSFGFNGSVPMRISFITVNFSTKLLDSSSRMKHISSSLSTAIKE